MPAFSSLFAIPEVITFALNLDKFFFCKQVQNVFSEAPKLIPLPSSSQTENSSFRLMCHTFAGTKPVFYQWTKNGQTLANSPQSDYKIEIHEDHSQFVIKSVDRNDSGNYSCIARNAFGTDSQSALLIVKGLKNSFRNKIYNK